MFSIYRMGCSILHRPSMMNHWVTFGFSIFNAISYDVTVLMKFSVSTSRSNEGQGQGGLAVLQNNCKRIRHRYVGICQFGGGVSWPDCGLSGINTNETRHGLSLRSIQSECLGSPRCLTHLWRRVRRPCTPSRIRGRNGQRGRFVPCLPECSACCAVAVGGQTPDLGFYGRTGVQPLLKPSTANRVPLLLGEKAEAAQEQGEGGGAGCRINFWYAERLDKPDMHIVRTVTGHVPPLSIPGHG